MTTTAQQFSTAAGCAAAPSLTAHPQHPEHNTDGIVGYLVRHTMKDGRRLPDTNGRVGTDLAVYLDPHDYGVALSYARDLRTPGNYAVIDTLYACGCRS